VFAASTSPLPSRRGPRQARVKGVRERFLSTELEGEPELVFLSLPKEAMDRSRASWGAPPHGGWKGCTGRGRPPANAKFRLGFRKLNFDFVTMPDVLADSITRPYTMPR